MITRSKQSIYMPKQYLKNTQQLEDPLPEPAVAALKDPKWEKDMKEEYQALTNNETWTLVPFKLGLKLRGKQMSLQGETET